MQWLKIVVFGFCVGEIDKCFKDFNDFKICWFDDFEILRSKFNEVKEIEG